ncbi:MAG: DUF4159 domain-containing protein [Rhizobiales bacterium]|nr:DUF4159 domain-containing protein [Hyphomicrobiales bacterium]
MLHLGALAFASPWMLLGLLALPGIWWLVRISPPRPKLVRFPAIRLLAEISHEEETPAHTPLWVLILRMLLATFVILGLARPLWNPAPGIAGTGPLLIILDNGWTSAAHWRERSAALDGLLAEARRNNRPVMLAATAPEAVAPELVLEAADDAATRATSLTPRSWLPDRIALLKRLQTDPALQNANVQTVWLSDGLDDRTASDFAKGLAALSGIGGLSVLEPDLPNLPLALLPPATKGDSFIARITAAPSAITRNGNVRALAADGAMLSEAAFALKPDETIIQTELALPLELRNRITRITIAGETSAGALNLIDESWQRRSLGIIANTSFEEAQPLLSNSFYLERALSPFAEIRDVPSAQDVSDIKALLAHPLAVLVLADIGTLTPSDRDLLTSWVRRGGLLIRFAGTHVAGATPLPDDPLLPVRLRAGGRELGGALSWTSPQHLAPFDPDSPFYGLDIPDDVTVSRQVLAEPSANLQAHVWARLQDGTPLVTEATQGKGRVVLFHVTANSEWSNLPLSGLYVEMLRRIAELAQGEVSATGTEMNAPENMPGRNAARNTLPPVKILDGFGHLVSTPATVTPIATNAFAATKPGPRHPAGFYGPVDNPRALNTTNEKTALTRMGALPGVTSRAIYAVTHEIRLRPLALLIATLLILIDGVAALWITGHFQAEKIHRRRFASRFMPVLLVAILAGLVWAPQVRADESADDFALKASLETHLAYVLTGDSDVDNISEAGLAGLSRILTSRTAFEPAAPMGVDITRDELAFFPLLYWPMTPAQPPLSPETYLRIDTYLRNGGTIFFDTRDQDTTTPGQTGPGTETLRRLLERMDIPALQQVGKTHVITRSYYLLSDFPGRWQGGPLWIEVNGNSQGAISRDGVSPLIIGSNDYAAAWARDNSGRAMFPCVPGGEMQREMAMRVGVNIVMYALTGNYKSDQVHVPALLERLGQ